MLAQLHVPSLARRAAELAGCGGLGYNLRPSGGHDHPLRIPETRFPVAKSKVKTYGPTAGRRRPKKMGMGSGRAILKARNPKSKSK